jgi:hypothetical protein
LGLLLTAGAAVLAVSSGCGGDVNETGAGGNGGDGGASTMSTGTSTATTMTTSSSSTGGMGGMGGTGGMGACAGDKDGNCNIDTAEPIELNDQNPIEGDLEPVDEDEDFYTFEGTAGQALFIYTDAKQPPDEFSNDYADLVITLYDANGKAIAENDDPTPRLTNDSEILTILPADGTYYVRVEECSTWAAQNNLPDTSCAPAGDILDTSYKLSILELDPAYPFVSIESKDMDIANQASAPALEYEPGMAAGTYIISINAGYYTNAMDKDYFKFTVPVDNAMTPASEGIKLDPTERLVGYFNFPPPGASGNGSTSPLGLISIIDPTTMQVHAQIDGKLSNEMSPPLQVGKEYLIEMAAPASGGDFAGNPFYFFTHNGGGSNPVEKELGVGGMPNNTTLTAEALAKAMNTQSYFVEGDITGAPVDVDYFKVAVPAGTNVISVACGAKRSGSGLNGFKVTIVGSDGMKEIMSATEAADKDLFLNAVAVPAGSTDLFLKLEAAGQNMGVTSSFYRCGFHFNTM